MRNLYPKELPQCVCGNLESPNVLDHWWVSKGKLEVQSSACLCTQPIFHSACGLKVH